MLLVLQSDGIQEPNRSRTVLVTPRLLISRLLARSSAMLRKLVLMLFIVALVSFVAFVALRLNAPPAGIETKGAESGSVDAQIVTLSTSIVSLLTAIVGLIKTTRKDGG
jgi:hypothetical protein